MSPRFIGFCRGSIAVTALLASAVNVAAETKLSEFNGSWRGAGTDRNSPLESAHPTTCQMQIRADLTHLSSTTRCKREGGFAKVLNFSVKLDGDQLTGTAGQTSVAKPGAEAESLNGKVDGTKADDEANLTIRFPGLMPNASLVLKRTAPSTFSMVIASTGITLTDVVFHRAGVAKGQ